MFTIKSYMATQIMLYREYLTAEAVRHWEHFETIFEILLMNKVRNEILLIFCDVIPELNERTSKTHNLQDQPAQCIAFYTIRQLRCERGRFSRRPPVVFVSFQDTL